MENHRTSNRKPYFGKPSGNRRTKTQEKQKEWGRAAFADKLEKAWKGFIPEADGWLNVKENAGLVALQEDYLKMLKGDFEAKDGFIFGT